MLEKLDADGMAVRFDKAALGELTHELEAVRGRVKPLMDDFNLKPHPEKGFPKESGKISVRDWRDADVRKKA